MLYTQRQNQGGLAHNSNTVIVNVRLLMELLLQLSVLVLGSVEMVSCLGQAGTVSF